MKRFILFLALTLAAACQASDVVRPEVEGPALAMSPGGAHGCPAKLDYVVGDQASLVAALAHASPGQVIGLEGLFEVSEQIAVGVDDLTLTCATPGSGLRGTGDFFSLIWIQADRVRVERLRFEAGPGLQAAIFAGRSGVGSGAAPVVTGNTFECRSTTCAWFNNSAGPVVTNNRFDISVADNAFSAIQIQQLTTAARVEDNTILGPRTFGQTGIRIRSGADHVVAGNRVSGPWRQSLMAATPGNLLQGPLSGNLFKSNELEGAREFGLVLAGQVCDWTATDAVTGDLVDWCRWFRPATGNVIRNNRISGAGRAGIALDAACGNTIVGNRLSGNANDTGAILLGVDVFDEVIDGIHWVGRGNNQRPMFPPGIVSGGGTGDNSFAGNGSLVIDDGDLDCDRDGEPDPNLITGAGAVAHGARLGREIGDLIPRQRPGQPQIE